MKQEQINKLKKWFDDYSSKYYKGDEKLDYPVQLKYNHSKRVCKEASLINNSLPDGMLDKYIVETIALFHDLGRFEQYRIYKTFNDRLSKNHAVLSIQEMNKHKLLIDCTSRERYLISNAVRYHNALTPPINKDNETKNYINIIRDADKLDILNMFSDYYSNKNFHDKIIELNLPDTSAYSKSIVNNIFAKKPALMADMKNLNDFKLIQIAWIYDINYKKTYYEIKKRHLIENITEKLPKNAEIEKIIDQIFSFIEKQI